MKNLETLNRFNREWSPWRPDGRTEGKKHLTLPEQKFLKINNPQAHNWFKVYRLSSEVLTVSIVRFCHHECHIEFWDGIWRLYWAWNSSKLHKLGNWSEKRLIPENPKKLSVSMNRMDVENDDEQHNSL